MVTWLKPVLNFAGTLFPVIFPKNEFNPKNLGVVVIILTVSFCGVYALGEDKAETAKDIAVELVEAVEEIK